MLGVDQVPYGKIIAVAAYADGQRALRFRGAITKYPLLSTCVAKIFDLTKLHVTFLNSIHILKMSLRLSIGIIC